MLKRATKSRWRGRRSVHPFTACITLLEAYFGCGFYSGTLNPSRLKTIRLPASINDVQNPALEFRDVGWHSTLDTVFAAKMRINSDHSRRVSNSYGRGSIMQAASSCIPFSSLLPANKYYNAHPEYFGPYRQRRPGYIRPLPEQSGGLSKF